MLKYYGEDGARSIGQIIAGYRDINKNFYLLSALLDPHYPLRDNSQNCIPRIRPTEAKAEQVDVFSNRAQQYNFTDISRSCVQLRDLR